MPSTTFRPHRTLLAVGGIAVASVLGSALLHDAAQQRAVDRMAEQRSAHVAAERAATDLLAAYDVAAPAGIRLVQGFAVATPEEISEDFEHFQAIMSRIQSAWTTLEARAEGVVDPAVVLEAGEAMKRYNDYAAEGFTLTELGPDSAVMLITKMREAGSPFVEARGSIEAVRTAARDAADEASAASEAQLAADRQRLRTVDGALAALVALLTALGALHLRRGASRVRRSVEALARDDRRTDFEARLQRGLEMANNEEAAFDIAAPALAEAAGEATAELLVADTNRGPLRRVAATSDAPGCGVTSPDRCPAARRGQTLTFPTSTALDVCPHLKGRPGGDCSAVCVPVNVGGNAVGVVHVTGPDGAPLVDESVTDVEIVARRTSERITVLRVFAHTGGTATDALTGLLDRRGLDERVRELEEAPEPATYAVAFGDLDRFKLFNDVHGPDGGDRALRLFAAVLRDSVRPSDIPARYGGEEFVVVLPGCSADEAQRAMDRVRENLALALASGRVPPFTVSFGIATSVEGEPFERVLAAADAALLAAKRAGRDRVLLAGTA